MKNFLAALIPSNPYLLVDQVRMMLDQYFLDPGHDNYLNKKSPVH